LKGEDQCVFPFFFFRDIFENAISIKKNNMGELRSRGESLERTIIEITRELDKQRDRVVSLSGEVKYIAEKAEKMEEENVRLKKQIDDQERRFEKEKADLLKQK